MSPDQPSGEPIARGPAPAARPPNALATAPSARRLTRVDFLIAAALAIGTFVSLAATSRGVGYVRDEGHYFHAGAAYARWFEALWDDVAAVRLKSGETVRGARISGDENAGLLVRVPGGKRAIAAADIAKLDITAHPDRARVFDKHFMNNIWRENFEHPALMKVLFVLSHRVFYERLGWLNQGDAYRMPAWLFAALLIWLTYLFGVELLDRRAGLFAALALITQPHVFFHAHLACFDVPVVTLWVAVLYAFWKAQASTYWAITCGTVLAVAMATKHNAFFLPFILVAYWVASRWRELRFPKIGGVRRLQLPPIPLAFISCLILAPLLYWALWPHLWHDPIQKFGAYLGFHMNHEHYDTPYLGTILKNPPFPWHFPFVMSLLTVPELTVWLGGVGFMLTSWHVVPWAWGQAAWRWLRARMRTREPRPLREAQPATSQTPPLSVIGALQGESVLRRIDVDATFPTRPARLFATDQIELLLWLGCLVPFAIIAHPKTPVFGGTKHWMNAMPIVALFAAAAFNLALRGLAWRAPALARRPNILFGVLAALVLAPSFVALVRTGPYGTSYHNLFAGGLNGAVRVGNTIQFWGPTLRNVADWLNANAEQGAGVCHHEANSRTWVVDQRDGIIRKDLVGLTGLGRDCDYQRADYMVYQHMQEYQNNEVETWQSFGTVFPVHTVALDGMLLVSVYKKPIRRVPESGPTADLLYGNTKVGTLTTEAFGGQKLVIWGKRGPGGKACEGLLKGQTLERAGAAATQVRDLDDAYRTLSQACFGSRLPR